jgi:hypothetical protein
MKRLFIAIIISFLSLSVSYCQEPKQSPSILNAKNNGEARARQDISRGTKRILYYGKPWSVGKPLVDEESGLPIEILAGCDVTPEFAAETDSYNKVMRENAKKEVSRMPGLVMAKAGNSEDWGPSYVPGMEHGPAERATSIAFGKAEAFMSRQTFAKEFAKRACSGSASEVRFSLLSDKTGHTYGVVKVDPNGQCSWLGIKK